MSHALWRTHSGEKRRRPQRSNHPRGCLGRSVRWCPRGCLLHELQAELTKAHTVMHYVLSGKSDTWRRNTALSVPELNKVASCVWIRVSYASAPLPFTASVVECRGRLLTEGVLDGCSHLCFATLSLGRLGSASGSGGARRISQVRRHLTAMKELNDQGVMFHVDARWSSC